MDESESSRGQATPGATMQRYLELLHARELEPLLQLYEASAVFIAGDGTRSEGHEAIRETLRGLLSLSPVLRLEQREEQGAGNLAFVANEWSLRGTTPDGQAIEQHGKSAVVLRRHAQRGWLIAIDRP